MGNDNNKAVKKELLSLLIEVTIAIVTAAVEAVPAVIVVTVVVLLVAVVCRKTVVAITVMRSGSSFFRCTSIGGG